MIALHNQNRRSLRLGLGLRPSPAQGLFRLGKNQSSGTKVIDRSDLHTHTHTYTYLMVRVRGRCNCYAPSSESNQINNNRPQLEPVLQQSAYPTEIQTPFVPSPLSSPALFPLLGHVNFNLISVPSFYSPPLPRVCPPPLPPTPHDCLNEQRLSNNYTATSLGQHAAKTRHSSTWDAADWQSGWASYELERPLNVALWEAATAAATQRAD